MARRTQKQRGGAKFNPKYAHGRHVTEKKKIVEELKKQARQAQINFFVARAKLAKAAKEDNMFANLFGKLGVSNKKSIAKKSIAKKPSAPKRTTRKQSRVSKFKQAELNAAAAKLLAKPNTVYNRASRAAKRGLRKSLRTYNGLEEMLSKL